MPLNLYYTMVQNSQKWPKTQIKGGPALMDEKCFFIFVDCFFSNQRQWNKRTLAPQLLCIRKACMLRYCALSRSLVKFRRQDTSFAHFSRTLRSLCLILSWRALVKSKNKFNKNLRQGPPFHYVYFLFSIFHSNRPKKRGKESRVLKKPIIFCAKELIHTVGNKGDHNKALLKIWRESDKRAILFFQTKKKNINTKNYWK